MEEFRKILDRYRIAFESLDAPAISSFYHIPTTGINSKRVHCFQTEDALVANFTDVVSQLAQARLGRAAFEIKSVTPLNAALYQLSISWSLSDADGGPIRNLDNIYTFGKYGNEDWKIVSVIQLD